MSFRSKLRKKTVNAGLGLLMRPTVQRMLLPFGRDLNPEKWIFIVGCYDSGTTLLATILGQLPEFGGLPNEGQFLAEGLAYPETYGWPRMFCNCLDKLQMSDANTQLADRIKKQWSVWYPREARFLVEKSITNMIRMDFLQKYFANAYFIHIIRDGYAVAKGIQKNANMRRWNAPYEKYPIELCARQWKVADDIATEQAQGLDNYLPVYYEDFAEKTGESMARILDFLGVAQDGVDIINQDWTIHGSKSKIINMNFKEYDLLSEHDISIIQNVAGDALDRHSYEPPKR